MIPLHLGALHPGEQVLTLVLALGPFLLLGIVVLLRRRYGVTPDGDAPAQTGEGAAAQVKTGTTASARSRSS